MDVSPTIAQFFFGSGISIPAESCGKIHPLYNEIEDNYKIQKLNAMQMRTYANWWGYSADEGTYKKALSLEAAGNLESALREMDDYVSALKQPLLDLKKFPLFEVIVYPGIVSPNHIIQKLLLIAVDHCSDGLYYLEAVRNEAEVQS